VNLLHITAVQPLAGWCRYVSNLKLEDDTVLNQLLLQVGELHRDESGQDLIEYALVVALIAFAAIAGMNFVASEINVAFSKIGNKLTSAIS
jgi:pilus assembly protein Flp/PilA